MTYQMARERLANRLQLLRNEKGLTQEQLAEKIGKSTEHISFLERAERSPSFETLIDLAVALDTTVADLFDERSGLIEPIIATLDVAPPAAGLPEPARPEIEVPEHRASDLKRLEMAMRGLRDMQQLANEYGINDILQDNSGKVLQVLILLGLKMLPGREGNDAIDGDGNEYELKTVNLALNARAGITTHHHLNKDILDKYRQVRAWYIAIYSGIELQEIYRVTPADLEPIFSTWEEKIARTGQQLNNPKIPMRLVRQGERVYPLPLQEGTPGSPPETA